MDRRASGTSGVLWQALHVAIRADTTVQSELISVKLLAATRIPTSAWEWLTEVDGFYWTDSDPDIVNSGREEQGLISL